VNRSASTCSRRLSSARSARKGVMRRSKFIGLSSRR
jgi:hypothetical protein